MTLNDFVPSDTQIRFLRLAGFRARAHRVGGRHPSSGWGMETPARLEQRALMLEKNLQV